MLRTSRGATLSVSFSTSSSPTQALLVVTSAGGDEQRFDLAAANPTHLSAALDPGVYVFALFTRWDSGDASYFFRVQVEPDAAAPPTSMVRAPSSGGQGQLPATGSDVAALAVAGTAMISMGAVMLLARGRKGPH